MAASRQNGVRASIDFGFVSVPIFFFVVSHRDGERMFPGGGNNCGRSSNKKLRKIAIKIAENCGNCDFNCSMKKY